MRTRKVVAKKRRNPDVKNLAARRLTGHAAVISALEDKLQQTERPLNRAKVDALCARIGALPVVDARTVEEILSYTISGIPRGGPSR
jgi:hypothetical protein